VIFTSSKGASNKEERVEQATIVDELQIFAKFAT